MRRTEAFACVSTTIGNVKTRKDTFPLPHIEESLDGLLGAQWFSTPASAYNQLPVLEQDKPKTAFCTLSGLFDWNCVPFGLCNTPSIFQRLKQRKFRDQQCQSFLVYFDNIIVFSSSVSQHLQRLDVVLDCLQKEGLKVKLEKCFFFWREGGVLETTDSPYSGGEMIAPQDGFVLLKQWEPLVEKEGVLHHRVHCPDEKEEILQLILPSVLKQDILTQLHQEHGHQDVECTMELVRQCCFWLGMISDIKQCIQRCQCCQVAKDTRLVALWITFWHHSQRRSWPWTLHCWSLLRTVWTMCRHLACTLSLSHLGIRGLPLFQVLLN